MVIPLGHNKPSLSKVMAAVMSDAFWRDGRYLGRSLGNGPSWNELLEGQPNERYRYLWQMPILDDQARFQQRQLLEKEQKLLKMYENSQAKVLGRLAGQSPPAPAPPGKVRQMFEERRTKAGIDKSYPLQPLKANATSRNISQNVTLEIKQVSSFNGDVLKSQKIETRIIRDKNSNEENLGKPLYTDSLDETDHVSNKLPNVGRSLRNSKTNKVETVNDVAKKTPAPKEKTSNQKITPSRTTPVASPKTSVSKPSKPQAIVHNIDNNNTDPNSNSDVKVNSAEKVKSPKKPTSMASSSSNVRPKVLSPANSSAESGEACRVCQRRFAADRIQKHEQICSRSNTKKRKPYDALKHRVAGTEVEIYVKHIKKNSKTQPTRNTTPVKASNWRKKHEEFIMAIRAAKQVQAHLSKGGKLADLPPPPPSDTSDYISCPHCNRRFNQSAAERHIPKCANFQFNKPKPLARKR